MLHISSLFCNIHVAVLPAAAMLAVCYHIALLSMQGTACLSGCQAAAMLGLAYICSHIRCPHTRLLHLLLVCILLFLFWIE